VAGSPLERAAMNVFTYGSLMYPQVWDRVVRGRYRNAPALLSGFERRALSGASYPGAIRNDAARIRGRVYFDVDAADLARLDAFESVDYRREDVVVALAEERGEAVPAQIYVYLDRARLLAHDWDVARFEQDHLAGFADDHGAGTAAGGG